MNSPLIELLGTATNQPVFIFTPPWLWLLTAIILSSCELILPKALGSKFRLYALMMGICALIVSCILWRASVTMGFIWQYIMYDGLEIQIMYWMGLSFTFLIWVRPAFIQRKKVIIPDATEAKTVTEFLPGATGRVMYEGCFWSARCADKDLAIASQQRVYVLRREGNTLIIAPETLFQS